ncbi:MAG: hypothetical protein U0167_05665 [bacterium]
MRPTSLSSGQALHRPSVLRRIAGFAALLSLAACSQKGTVPHCDNCASWVQRTNGLARYPAPHPSNRSVFAYSTIEKTPGASDASRQADEDIWLTWVVSDTNAALNSVWQITGDEMGTTGDNFAPRWSPAGDQIAFVHTTGTGIFEIWRVPVTIPASAQGTPVVGAPVRVASGRDVAWASDTRLVFTRDNKLFQIDVAPPGPAVQLSYNPPSYASGDEFVDRTPDFSLDGGGVFNSVSRQNVADAYLRAFEVDRSIFPPDTLVTDAFVYFQPPGGVAAYPIFEGADTLRTPVLMRSLPVGDGGDFRIGVRLDSRLLDRTRENYCDTTLTKVATLRPGESDTLSYYFEIARGSLKVQTNASNTTVNWTRSDGLTSDAAAIANSGGAKIWNCLLSYQVVGGVPAPPTLETYIVSASRTGSADTSTTVVIAPGDTTVVVFYPSGGVADPRQWTTLSPASAISTVSGRSRSADALGGASLSSLLRVAAAAEAGSVWRVQLGNVRAQFDEILGAASLIQSPAISDEMSGVRYLAFVASEADTWSLFVQRVAVDRSGGTEVWRPDGDAVKVEPPGSSENFACTRNVFYPRFLPGSVPGHLHVLVSMSNCPDNGFGTLGFDEDPWAIGELRIWEVEVLQ